MTASDVRAHEENETVESVACPECGADNEVSSEAEIGEILTCAECGVELEVLTVGPVTVGLAPEEGEDWGE